MSYIAGAHDKHVKTDDQHHHHEHDIEDIDRQLTQQQHDVDPESPILSDSMPKDDLHLRTTN